MIPAILLFSCWGDGAETSLSSVIALYVHALGTAPFIIPLLKPFQKRVPHSRVNKTFGYLSQNCGGKKKNQWIVILPELHKFQRKYSN